MFGQGVASFYVNSPQAVAQAVETRLCLQLAEFWLDVTDGTPWHTQVLGSRTTSTRDAALRLRILRTPGVTGIASYNATVDPITRAYRVAVGITTPYGPATAAVVVPTSAMAKALPPGQSSGGSGSAPFTLDTSALDASATLT